MQPSLKINPPLLNTPNPWCSSFEQLQALYESPHTGAVTVRTSMINAYPDDRTTHQYVLFDPLSHSADSPNNPQPIETPNKATLNTLVYSSISTQSYLDFIQQLSDNLPEQTHYKPFIVSVGGTPDELVECYKMISHTQQHVKMPLAMELNLSCPNVLHKSSPAYDSEQLMAYLTPLKHAVEEMKQKGEYQNVAIGIKLPPFTYQEQFETVIDVLLKLCEIEPQGVCPIQFITSTNTLGNALVLTQQAQAFSPVLVSLAGTGIGGMAGAALHPLALGNVFTLKQLLKQHEMLAHIQLIGVGGVEDRAGFLRMQHVGADFVGVASAIGRKGLNVFAEILTA